LEVRSECYIADLTNYRVDSLIIKIKKNKQWVDRWYLEMKVPENMPENSPKTAPKKWARGPPGRGVLRFLAQAYRRPVHF